MPPPPSTKISERDTVSESEPEHFQHAEEHGAFNLTMKTPCSAQNAPSLSRGLGSNEGSLGKRRWLCFTIFSRRHLLAKSMLGSRGSQGSRVGFR